MVKIKKSSGTVAKGLQKGVATTKKGTKRQPPGTGQAGSFGYPHKT